MLKRQKKYFKYISKNILLMSGSFILILSLILYYSYVNFTRNTYQQSLKHNASQSSVFINNCIEQTTDLTYFLSNEDTIKDFVNSAPNDTIKKIYAMKSLEISWLFKGDIAAIKPETDTVITSSSSMSKDFYITSFGLDASEFNECTETLIKKNTQRPIVLFDANEKGMMFVIHYVNQLNEPLFLVYSYNLPQILPKADTTGSLCIMQNGKLLSSIGKLSPIDINEAIADKSDDYELLSITTHKIPYIPNGYCTYVVPEHEYLALTSSFVWIVLLVFICFVGLAYLIARLISKKIYNPINKLLDTIKDINDTTASNELEFISNKITLLNDKNKVLFDLVGSHTKKMSDIFFLNLLNGSLPKDEADAGVTEYNFDNFCFPVAVFVAKIFNYEAFTNVLDSSGLHILQNDILKRFELNFDESEFRIINTENNKFVGVISARNLTIQKKKFISLISNVEESLEAQLRICVGTEVFNWYELSQSYGKASNIFDKYYFLPSSPSVIYSNEIANDDIHVYYPSEEENLLVQSIVQVQSDETSRIIGEIIDTNYNTEMLDMGIHGQLVTMLVSTLTKVFMTINKPSEAILPNEENIYSALIIHKDPENLKNEFLRIANIISDYTNSLRGSTDQKIAQSMIAYICENYAQYDISLTSLASHLNMSQSHISRLFKQLIGENFKDYLAKYRITIAKDIISEKPAIKTKDLAKAVGYANSETFTKVFKRYEGCLPSEYMKK